MSEERRQESVEGIERGRDLSRIVAFSDGVFAIAITLLVLQIEVPQDVHSASALWQAIGDEGGDLFAYGLSFLVIGLYWLNHHRFMRTVEEFDPALMLLNIVYLAFVVLIPFLSQLVGEYGDLGPSVLLYALDLAVISLLSALMYRHVVRAGLVKERYTEYDRLSVGSALFNAAVFTLTAPLGFLIGSWTFLTWLVMRFDPFERRRNRHRERVEGR